MLNIDKITKSNQEQATASWINYLNQIRLDQLTKILNQQNINLDNALVTVNKTLNTINKEIIFNGKGRGGKKGMHGFIAEVAECGIGNARQEILGKQPNYVWIDDNGPIDLIRGDANIQQKFVNSGSHLSLEAIKKHHEAYPWFLNKNNVYQIPKDHYDKIKYYLSISENEANKMPTQTGEFSLKQWKEVHAFFEQGDIPLEKIEPSILKYDEVQRGEIEETISLEKKSIKKTDKEVRKKAYDNSKPSLLEGGKIAITSSAIEGGTTFIIKIIKKQKAGRKIQDFDTDDWREILAETSTSTVKGGIRGISVYALTNYTATPASVANSVVTCSFGIAELANHFRKGEISEDEFLMKSEIVCLDTSISALSSFMGQALIPIPVLGAIIGNTIGNLMYQITKDNLSKYEKKLIKKYLTEIDEHNHQLDKEYYKIINDLTINLNLYMNMLEKAFTPDYRLALDNSVQLAICLGVNENNLLKNVEEIDNYFLN